MPAGVGYGEFEAGARYQGDEPGIRDAADWLKVRDIPITGDSLARAMVAIQRGAGGAPSRTNGNIVDDVIDGDAGVQTIRAPTDPYKTRYDPIPSQQYSPPVNGMGPDDRTAPAAATLTPDAIEGAGVDTDDDGGMPNWLKVLLLGSGAVAAGGVVARGGRERAPTPIDTEARRGAVDPESTARAAAAPDDTAPVRPTTRPAVAGDRPPGMGPIPEEMRLAMDAARRGDVDALRTLATSQDEVVRVFAETQLAVLERARTGVLERGSPDPRFPRVGERAAPGPNVEDTLTDRRKTAARRIRRFGMSK
jgi:hypothetical protein